MTTAELQEYGKPASAVSRPIPPPIPTTRTTKTSTAHDADADIEEIPRLSPEPLDNKELPCAFWDALPEPGTDHPDLAAIEALKAESSPMERAETLKVQANDALKRGMQLKKSFYVLESVSLYNQALALLAPPVERSSADEFFDKGDVGGGKGVGGDKAGEGASTSTSADGGRDARQESPSASTPQPSPSKGDRDGRDEEDDAPFPPPRPEELAAMRATLHSNRAQAHLTLGNDRRALSDALAAAKLFEEASEEIGSDVGLTKARFRAARAALRLGDWGAAGDAIDKGRQSALGAGGSKDDAAAVALAKDFDALSVSLSKSEAAARKADEARRAAESAARAPSLAVAREIACARRWRVGCPQLSVGADRNKPWAVPVGEEGQVGKSNGVVIHWPMVFIYPESGATDAVEAASEHDPMSSHLDAMFGSVDPDDPSPPPPPLPWDEHGAYSKREEIEIYYLSHATEPLPSVEALADVLHMGWPEGHKPTPPRRHGPRAARAIRVDERQTLGQVLSREDHVVPGIPAFFVLSKSERGRAREVRRRFLEEHG